MKKLWFSGLLVPTLSLTPGVSFAQTQVKIQKAQAIDKLSLVKNQIESYNKAIKLSIETQQKIVNAPKLKNEDKIMRISMAANNLKTAKNSLKSKLKSLKLKDATIDKVDPKILDIFNEQVLASTQHKDLLSNIPQDILAIIEINHVDLWRMNSKIISQLEIVDDLIDQLEASIKEQKVLLTLSDNQKIFKVSVKQIESAKNISDRMISLNTTVIERHYDDLVEISKPDSTSYVAKFLKDNITRMSNEDEIAVNLLRDKKLGKGDPAIEILDELVKHLEEQNEQIQIIWANVVNSGVVELSDLSEFEKEFIKKMFKESSIEALKLIKEQLAYLYI